MTLAFLALTSSRLVYTRPQIVGKYFRCLTVRRGVRVRYPVTVPYERVTFPLWSAARFSHFLPHARTTMSHARPTPHQNTLHVVAQGDKCYRHADAPGCAAESISYMSYLLIQGWYITRIHFDEGFMRFCHSSPQCWSS